MNDYPRQYAMARANVIGGMTADISKALTDVASRIPEFIRQKNINDKIDTTYKQILSDFETEVKAADPSIDKVKMEILKRKYIPQPMEELGPEANLKNLLNSAPIAQKYVDNLKAESSASQFTSEMRQPITGTRQIQAEGPPIQGERAEGPPIQTGERFGEVPMQAGARTGEVPMEEQRFSRPPRASEYEEGMAGLTPEAREMVPEGLGSQVKQTEEIFQNPMKIYEEQIDKKRKEQQSRIKTLASADKGAAIQAGIGDSKIIEKTLQAKQKTLNKLIDTVAKMAAENPEASPRQIVDGTESKLGIEVEALSQELGIPSNLATNTDFLGRMSDKINTLVQGEKEYQKNLDESYKLTQERLKEESRRKTAPKPPTSAAISNAEIKLQDAVDQKLKQSFPDLYNVIPGEYNVQTMKKVNGIVEAGRQIAENPNKRAALAYAYNLGNTAQLAGIPRPSQQEIDAVQQELKALQDRMYGIINQPGAKIGGKAQQESLDFSGLGGGALR